MSRQRESAKSGPSQTAQLAAAHRAYHSKWVHPAILDDSAAIWLLGPPLSVILRVALLRRLLWDRLLARVRPISAFIAIRSRYAEDCLERAIGAGCRQYVILGAGLDSWALRHEAPGVSVFELDRPATQRWKEARVRARLGALPPHLALVPIDFERQAVAEALLATRYDQGSRALVSWLGTICYLTREAIEQTLVSLATACAPGSQVVFDYFQPRSAMSPADLQLFEELDRGGTRRGEPMRTLLTAEEVAAMMHSAGYRILEDLSAGEIRDRYLSQRTDDLDIPGFARLCRAERLGAGLSR